MEELLKQNKLFDSHCHLSDSKFDHDRDEVISQARKAGLAGIADVAVDLNSYSKIKSYSTEHPGFIIPGIGFHPELLIPGSDLYDPGLNETEIAKLTEEMEVILASDKSVGLVGECGLDYYWLKKSVQKEDVFQRIKTLQQKLFTSQLKLAVKHELPVSVHARDAHADAMRLLAEYSAKVTVIMHSFTGDYAQASEILEAGMFIGINGIVTYPSAKVLREGLKQIISEKRVSSIPELYAAGIILETDSPYLTPQQKRGSKNTPDSVGIIAEFLLQN
jgi:TatD DNase family protein